MSAIPRSSLRAIRADIVTRGVDAIVNAANSSLLGVAVTTVRDVGASGAGPREVVFCCFSQGDLAIYEALLAA